MTSVFITVVGLDSMIDSFQKLSVPPGFKTIGRLEKTAALAFTGTQDMVHVITGHLKGSGITHTNFDGQTWSFEIDYDADPGQFELERGNAPTFNHPEGEHGFFDAVTPFLPVFEDNIDAWFRDAFNEQAPI